MKILFLARRYLYFRNFEEVICELASRGHDIHLAVERDDLEGRPALIDDLTARFTNITTGYAPSRADDDWSWVAARLRLGLDYLRYQHRLFDDAPKLRARARERTPAVFVALGDAIRRWARWARTPVAAVIRRIERAVPEAPAIRGFVEELRPDVVLMTPLIDLGSSQIDYLRAARQLRIPTAMCVWSWDHLSSKALIRECPDRVLVWNDTQKHEAVELHAVPPGRVVVTGAQCFDRWFGREPSRSRESFCRDMGLAGDRRFILYVCSALFLGSPPEAPFVMEWIRRVRHSSSERLRSMPILVRPHPSRTREWQGVDVSSCADVVIRGGSPVDASSRADYFDALYHSAAVVGLNTSAFIEAAIVGRPVLTMLPTEYHENQMGTVHFRYLLDASGRTGLLEVAGDFDEHLRQLDRAVEGAADGERAPSAFVRAFVRPHGLEVAATPLFVRAVEEMPGESVAAPGRDWSAPLSRGALARLARLRNSTRAERWVHSERELSVILRNRRSRAEKDRHDAERRAIREAAKEAGRAERRRELARHRAAKARREAQQKRMRQAQ